MSPAATVAAAAGIDVAALILSVVLGIWLPVMAAVALTVVSLGGDACRAWRRWRVRRRRVAGHPWN